MEEDKAVPTLTKVIKASGWYEREIHDMFGIYFDEHQDLRRILSDYIFEGYPLRKDFPVYGYKEVRYDEEQEKVVYEPVNLAKLEDEYSFDSPWQGMEKVIEETSKKNK